MVKPKSANPKLQHLLDKTKRFRIYKEKITERISIRKSKRDKTTSNSEDRRRGIVRDSLLLPLGYRASLRRSKNSEVYICFGKFNGLPTTVHPDPFPSQPFLITSLPRDLCRTQVGPGSMNRNRTGSNLLMSPLFRINYIEPLFPLNLEKHILC